MQMMKNLIPAQMLLQILFQILLQTIILTTVAEAQDDSRVQLRHIAGIRTIDFTGGTGLNSRNGELSRCKFYSPIFFLRTAFNFEKTNFPSTVLSDYSLKYSANFTVVKLSDKLFVNAELGFFSGLEGNTAYSPADDPTFLYPAATVFIYGVFAGGNLELYLNENVALVGSIQQWYMLGSAFGEWKYQMNGGFRFILN